MSRNNEPATTVARRNEGTMTRWNPWEEFNELRRQMDDMFSRNFGYTPLSRMIPNETMEFEPPVDIHETDDKFMAFAALPGYTVKDINLEATPETIKVTGERKCLFDKEKGISHKQSGLCESGSFSFYYTLPSEIDPNKVKATFTNGVLQLEMPKTERSRTKSVKVNIQGA